MQQGGDTIVRCPRRPAGSRELAEVHAGAEAVGTRDDSDAKFGVGLEPVEGVVQSCTEVGVHGVADVGTVQGQYQDLVALLDEERIRGVGNVRHQASFYSEIETIYNF